MLHNHASRSYEAQSLDGQGDDIKGKEPAWKGTVASRIRSINERDNAAKRSQTPARSVPGLRKEATRRHPHKPSDERTNPFVRRSPPRTPKPSVPERVSRSEVPVQSPVPSVLVQRPSFVGHQTRVGRGPAGKNVGGAETSPALKVGSSAVRSLSPAHATMRRFEELESKNKAEKSGNGATEGQKQRIAGPRAVTPSDLRSKDDPAHSIPESAPDARHGLKMPKASSPKSVRTASPSVGLGPRDTTFGRAGRVRTESPDERGQAKCDRAPSGHARLTGIESAIEGIGATSIGIEATAREIRAAAYRIGLFSSPATRSSIEAASASSSSATARMRKDTSSDGASPTSEPIDSECDAVIDNVMEQLQTCRRRLQRVRRLPRQSGPRGLKSASLFDEDRHSGSNLSAIPVGLCASPNSISDAPTVQRRRTRSISDVAHPVDDAEKPKKMAEELHRADEMVAVEMDPLSSPELRRLLSIPVVISPVELPGEPKWPVSGARPQLSSRYFNGTWFAPRTGGTERQYSPTPPPSPPIPREERLGIPTRRRPNTSLPISATSPSPHASRYASPHSSRRSTPSPPKRHSATRRHHSRQPSSYLSAKGRRTLVRLLLTPSPHILHPTPAVYFPYQHLTSAEESKRIDSPVPPELEQGDYCPIFSTGCEDPRGPIVQAPDTPPPPPPLFSMMPSMELELVPGSFFPMVLSPGASATPLDDPINNTTRTPEEQPGQYYGFAALSPAILVPRSSNPGQEQSIASKLPGEERTIPSNMSSKRSSPSKLPSKVTTPSPPSQPRSPQLSRLTPPPRPAAQRPPSPILFSPLREASPSPPPSNFPSSGLHPRPRFPVPTSCNRSPLLLQLSQMPSPATPPLATAASNAQDVPSPPPHPTPLFLSLTPEPPPQSPPTAITTPQPFFSTSSSLSSSPSGEATTTTTSRHPHLYPFASSTSLPAPSFLLSSAFPAYAAAQQRQDEEEQEEEEEEEEEEEHHQRYPPLNVLDRVRRLEDAQDEKMRVMRATGMHGDVMRRYSLGGGGGGGLDDDDEEEAFGFLRRSWSLGGPREQIGALGRPWW